MAKTGTKKTGKAKAAKASDYVAVSITIPMAIDGRLRAYAAKETRSLSFVIARALDAFLPKE